MELPTPHSIFIEKQLQQIRDRKGKNAFLESIMTDHSATTLNVTKGHRTVMFPGSNGPKTSTWEQTKRMAFALNEAGIDVAFLPEIPGTVCSDSLLRIGNTYRLADFKYCITTKSNTLAKELEHGFEQANTIVLKLKNMDVGLLKETLGYLVRNEISHGSILLINKYGKIVELTKNEINTGMYKKTIKGFL